MSHISVSSNINRCSRLSVSRSIVHRHVTLTSSGRGRTTQHNVKSPCLPVVCLANAEKNQPTIGVENSKQIAKRKPLPYGQTVFLKVQKSTDVELEVFGPSASDLKRLTARVKAARSWPEMRSVLQAMDTHAASLDPVFFTAVFSALPKLLRMHKLHELEQREVHMAVHELVKLVSPKLHTFDAQGLVSLVVGLAKLEHADKQLFQAIMRQSQHVMDRLTPQSLSNFIWALATVGVQPSGAWLTQFYRASEARLESFNSQDVANLWWGLTKLDLMPPWVSGGMPGMVDHALACMTTSASGQDPATIITCLAIYYNKFSYRLDDERLHGLLAAMQPGLASYLPQDLVSIVHSLVVMNYMPPRIWMRDFYVVLKDRLIFDPTLSYSDFQRLLWALSRIDYTPSQAWLRNFVEVSIGNLKHLKFRALSELVWALACWGYTPTKEWLAEYFRVTQDKLQDYRPQHLANSMAAMKKLGCKVPTTWMNLALLSFCGQLRDARAHDLVAFLDGIVDVCEDAAWMSQQSGRIRMVADVAASKFDICDCIMHAKLVIALATANCIPGPAWLSQQQDSLTRTLVQEQESLDTRTAQDLKQVYESWDVQLNKTLAAELDVKEV